MKQKLSFIALILTSMLALTGCPVPEPEPDPDPSRDSLKYEPLEPESNYWVSQYNFVNSMLNLSTDEVNAMLTGAGYFYDEEFNVYSFENEDGKDHYIDIMVSAGSDKRIYAVLYEEISESYDGPLAPTYDAKETNVLARAIGSKVVLPTGEVVPFGKVLNDKDKSISDRHADFEALLNTIEPQVEYSYAALWTDDAVQLVDDFMEIQEEAMGGRKTCVVFSPVQEYDTEWDYYLADMVIMVSTKQK